MTTTTTMLWTGTSTNSKTGNIPQGYIGATKQETEDTCKDCPMRKPCYAHNGTPRMAHASMQRAHEKSGPERYTLATALGRSVRTARYVRAGVIGDSSAFARATVQGWVDDIRAAGLKGLLNYTHFFDSKGSHLRGLAMASVDDKLGTVDPLVEADRAIDAGWRTAIALPVKAPGSTHSRVKNVPEWDGSPFTTPKGRRVVVCPAQQPELRKDCNTCGLCDATKHPGVQAIGFLQH